MSNRLRFTAVIAALALAVLTFGPAWAQGAPDCPSSWPGADREDRGGIEYQDFYVDHDGNRWFVIRSRDSNGYTHVRAYPENSDYALGYTPGEACSFVVRRPSDEDPREWEYARGLTGVEGDRQALAGLYRTAHGDGWHNNDGWLTSRPLSQWYGVDTDANGRVTSLNLKENGLTGTIDPGLIGLCELHRLELYGNEISGTIPPEIGAVSNLTWLDLDDSNLSGPIPPELGNLTNLTHLGLDRNELTGEIPPELGRLSKLEGLELYGNQLTGRIPPELGALSRLEVLALSYNSLSGEIPPELGELDALTILWLSNNSLSGEIPAELGGMDSMWWLTLNNNDLSGGIPEELVNLAELDMLMLSGNRLTGCVPAGLMTLWGNDFDETRLDSCDR